MNDNMLSELIVLLLIALFIGISQSAGIGGGAIINVLLITGLGFNAKESVIITYIFLMGGGLASTIASATKKNSQGKRLLDYNLVMITCPMMMSGAIFGTILNNFLSQMLITLFILFLVGYTTFTTYAKYSETKSKLKDQSVSKNSGHIVVPLQESRVNVVPAGSRLEEILMEEGKVVPLEKMKVILHIYAYTFIILVLRGGKSFDSLIGLERCSVGGWFCALLHLFLSYLYSKSIAIKQCQLDQEKQSLGYVFENSSDKMNENKMKQGMFNGFIAGLLGGTVSLGGGLLLIPLWLRAGLDRNIAASSTGPLIFFSSSISFLVSVLLGKYDSALMVLLFFLIAFAGSYFVKSLVILLVQKYKYNLLVLILLLFMMVISFFTLLPVQYQKYLSDSEDFMEFGQLC